MGGVLRCPRKHSFDVARSGYINLLQPQDRRSRTPGDTPQITSARGRVHTSGITAPLLDAIDELAQPIGADVVLDVGCGDGFYLGALAERHSFNGHGVDISVHSIDSAARRFPKVQWIVANADRFVPYEKQSFSLIFSITSRLLPSEFSRLLSDDGKLLVAIPSPEDLIALRGSGRDRVPRTLEMFAPEFHLIGQGRTTTTVTLEPQAIHDLRLAMYCPEEQLPPASQTVSLSLDLLLLGKRVLVK